jgi:3-oxoadipate enol-lactonase
MVLPTLEEQRERCHARIDGPSGAPVLVLSNSLGTNWELWDAQLPALTARFRVLRYDTRGHGSSPVTSGPYSVAMLAHDVLRLLDAFQVERAHFCGLSLGGMTGLWLGIHAAERVDRLVLANTAPRIATQDIWNARIASVRQGGMAAITDAVLERWFTAGFRARAPEAVNRIGSMLLATPSEGYVACCAALRDADEWPGVAGIRAPTLIIAGTHDVATPAAEGRQIAERIAGAQYVELDAAHISNVEMAGPFTAAVTAFLDAGRA